LSSEEKGEKRGKTVGRERLGGKAKSLHCEEMRRMKQVRTPSQKKMAMPGEKRGVKRAG